jgi:hypothetical protein
MHIKYFDHSSPFTLAPSEGSPLKQSPFYIHVLIIFLDVLLL